MPAPRTLVAIATYNEIENLPALVAEVHRHLPDADVLVVDDNSPDGTGRWCEERAAADAWLQCLHRAAKLGLGTATLAAFNVALDQSYELVATLDADWSHDPAHLPAMLAAAQRADVVIGSRYIAGGEVVGWPLHRRLLSRAINRLTRLLLRLPVRDSSGALRVYRVARLRDLDMTRIRATGYAYLEEILWHLARHDATFVELPITFHQRRAGQSKVSVQEAAGKLATLLRLAVSPRG